MNTAVYFLLWDAGINIDYNLKLDIHYFCAEYLISYQIYYLYTAVHLNVFFQAYSKQFVPFYISVLLSIFLFLFALSICGWNPAEGYPHGFLDDAFFRSGLHLFALVAVFGTYVFTSLIRINRSPDPREFALLLLYLIYNLIMIMENLFTANNFATYTYTYPFILAIAYFLLIASKKVINFMFLDDRFKNSVIAISVGMIFIEDFLAYKIMWFFIGFAFYSFRFYTNRIQTR